MVYPELQLQGVILALSQHQIRGQWRHLKQTTFDAS